MDHFSSRSRRMVPVVAEIGRVSQNKWRGHFPTFKKWGGGGFFINPFMEMSWENPQIQGLTKMIRKKTTYS